MGIRGWRGWYQGLEGVGGIRHEGGKVESSRAGAWVWAGVSVLGRSRGSKRCEGGNPTRGGEGEVFPCRGLGLGGGVGPGKEPGVTSG